MEHKSSMRLLETRQIEQKDGLVVACLALVDEHHRLSPDETN